MKIVGIYKITSPSGRIYIGQSIDILKRWKSYLKVDRSKGQKLLYQSFLKYGVENHSFEILQEFPPDIEQCILNNFEIFYISQYKCAKIQLLNLTQGGRGGMQGEAALKVMKLKRGQYVYTDEHKNNIRKALMGFKRSEEHCKNLSEANKGKTISEEQKVKVSQKLKGRPSPMKGRKVSEETKNKIRKANLGRQHSFETRRKIGENSLKAKLLKAQTTI
jgi:group I intron endonuclease